MSDTNNKKPQPQQLTEQTNIVAQKQKIVPERVVVISDVVHVRNSAHEKTPTIVDKKE